MFTVIDVYRHSFKIVTSVPLQHQSNREADLSLCFMRETTVSQYGIFSYTTLRQEHLPLEVKFD